ncbi:protein kinase [Candidatus Sumerlaeota bacterium]|nr:protein kinase [Candidatus Sumerlaeota bacterium]
MRTAFICSNGHVSVDGGASASGQTGASARCPQCGACGYSTLVPDGYEVLEELGAGGMGVVLKARRGRGNEIVALKLIKPMFRSEKLRLERFLTEARAFERISHPNIVRLIEVGRVGDLPYLALECVEGGSLAQRIQVSPLPPREAATMLESIARGVEFVHGKGILHRDLNPANILLTREGEPKITDFGLAKFIQDDQALTRTGLILGTPAYMAPEQARGENRRIGKATDVYALGVILYQAMTGRRPFDAESTAEVLHRIVYAQATLPRSHAGTIPRELEAICLHCMEKEPKRRYRDAGILARDLNRFLNGKPTHVMRLARIEAERRKRQPSAQATDIIERSGVLKAPSPVSKSEPAGGSGGKPDQAGLLRGLTIEQVDALLASGGVVELGARQWIFREGDKAASLFIVLKGKVEITRGSGSEEKFLACLGPNDSFGELGLLRKEGTRTASARTLEPSVLYELPGNPLKLVKLFFNPEITLLLLQNLMEVLRGRLVHQDRRRADASLPGEEPPPESGGARARERMDAALGILPASMRERVAEVKLLRKSQYLFREGKSPDGFYLLREGALELLQMRGEEKPYKLMELTAPHVVGEVGFFSAQALTASARATQPSAYMHLTAADFEELRHHHPAAAVELVFLALQSVGELLARRDLL